jgi:hypothetical protein
MSHFSTVTEEVMVEKCAKPPPLLSEAASSEFPLLYRVGLILLNRLNFNPLHCDISS